MKQEYVVRDFKSVSSINNFGERLFVNNRRSEIEIIGKILSLSQNGARKTKILYQANLSYSTLREYLFFLLEKQLLEEKIIKNNGSRELKVYHTTTYGNELLMNIQNIINCFNKNSERIFMSENE